MVNVSPGVFVRENDLSQYVPKLSTAILGLVGGANKGPLDDPILITNELDLIQRFGVPGSTNYMIYAAQEFLRAGRQMFLVRVADSSVATASITVPGLAQPAFFISSQNIGAGVDLSVNTTIRIDIDSTGTVDIDLTTGFVGPLTAVSLDHVILRINATFAGVASKDNTNSFLVLTSTTTGVLSSIEIFETTVPALNASPQVFGISSFTDTTIGFASVVSSIVIDAESPGDWVNNYSVDISTGTVTGTYKIEVFSDTNLLLNTFDNLTQDNVENAINGVSPNIVVTVVDFDVPPDPIVFNATNAAVKRFLGGGVSGITALTDADFIGTIDPVTGARSGLKAFADPELIDVNLLAVPGISSGPVQLELLALCEARADCFAVLDPPIGLLTPQDIADYHNGDGVFDGLHPAFNSSFGAIYWPWQEIFDSFSNQRILLPPSGFVLNRYAFNDTVAEVWDAPAGDSRGRLSLVLRTEADVDIGQRDFLYSGGNAVNPIVDFVRRGVTIWGQRTLQRSPTALDRVNVRRMLLFIQKTIATVLNALVFEPNNDKTWRRATALVTPFLNDIKSRDGLEDFLVRIDGTTTTAQDQNQNTLRGKIFLIPTKTAEIIEMEFNILPSGANFSDFT